MSRAHRTAVLAGSVHGVLLAVVSAAERARCRPACGCGARQVRQDSVWHYDRVDAVFSPQQLCKNSWRHRDHGANV